MAKSLYEYYTSGTIDEYNDTWDSNNNIFVAPGKTVLAQTFTVGTVGVNSNFAIEEVKLHLVKTGAPAGNLTVEIRQVTGAGVPDLVLATGTISMADIGALGWCSCSNFIGNTNLTASTKYAICIHHLSTTTAANYIRWHGTLTVDGYAGGIVFGSKDNGATWVDADAINPQDLHFQIFGDTFTGTLCTYEDVINKAGSGANSTAKSVSNVSNYVKQVESIVNVRTKTDWTTLFSTLNANKKYILSEIASNLAAIKVINYDKSGYTGGRLEAESIQKTLRDEAEQYIIELKTDIQDFVKNA